jgi:Glycosyl transferase family 2
VGRHDGSPLEAGHDRAPALLDSFGSDGARDAESGDAAGARVLDHTHTVDGHHAAPAVAGRSASERGSGASDTAFDVIGIDRSAGGRLGGPTRVAIAPGPLPRRGAARDVSVAADRGDVRRFGARRSDPPSLGPDGRLFWVQAISAESPPAVSRRRGLDARATPAGDRPCRGIEDLHPMDVCSPSTLPPSRDLQADGQPKADSSRKPPLGGFASDAERWEWLFETLGEAFCRKLGIFRVPDDLVLSVVIPCYNEKRTIHEILRRVREVPIRKEIIVVDDCSTDGTREILREMDGRDADLKIVFHERNQGKGAALRTGFRHATGQIVIVQDADLEYDPAQYPQLIQPIVEDQADVVYGSRFIGETHRVLYFWHSLANKFLTLLSNAFTNLNLTDMEVCYKVFRREIIQAITLKSDRFGFEPEVTAKVARFTLPAKDDQPARKCRIYEIPVSYHGRTYAEGKHIGVKDGFQALWCIVKYAYLN